MATDALTHAETALDQFTREQREAQKDPNRAWHDDEEPQQPVRRAGATMRDRDPPTRASRVEGSFTKAELDQMEETGLMSVMQFTQQLVQFGQDQQRLVRALRARRYVVPCTPAVVAEMDRLARLAIEEGASLNIQGRVDSVRKHMLQAWELGITAGRGEG